MVTSQVSIEMLSKKFKTDHDEISKKQAMDHADKIKKCEVEFKDKNKLTSRTKNFFKDSIVDFYDGAAQMVGLSPTNLTGWGPFNINEQSEQRLSDHLQRLAMSGQPLNYATIGQAQKNIKRETTRDYYRRSDAERIHRDVLINPFAYSR